jgi:hypothetical protein
VVGCHEESLEIHDELADVSGLERRAADDFGRERSDRLFGARLYARQVTVAAPDLRDSREDTLLWLNGSEDIRAVNNVSDLPRRSRRLTSQHRPPPTRSPGTRRVIRA